MFAASFLFAQERKIDSILQLVEAHKTNDSSKVKLLNTLPKYLTPFDISKSEEFIKQAVGISKQINYPKGLAESYLNYCIFNVQRGKFDSALEYALKARHLQDSIKDTKGLMLTNSSLAQIYIQLKKPEKAIDIQLENLEFFKSDSLNPNKARIHFYLATAYSDIKQYANAEKHYKAAKHIAEKTNFLTGVNIANSSLGVLARKQGDIKKSIAYLKSALIYYETNKQLANIAHTSMELGVSYSKLNSFDKAIYYNSKAIDIYKNQNNIKALSSAYKNQSNYYKFKNDIVKSHAYFLEHSTLKDSLYSLEKVNAIEDMQAKYENDKILKEKEVVEQQAEISRLESERSKNLFFYSIAVFLLILLVVVFYFGRQKAKKQTEITLLELSEAQKRLALEKQYKDTELKALKAQMNPHFIFNALNSIQEYILYNKKDLASDYLGKFSDLIRTYLHHSDTGYITIREELESLNLYLELEKLRFEDKLNYNISVDENLNEDCYTIPTMFIQPYVENALKHGLLHKKEDRKLSIEFNLIESDILECVITDNGIGRERSEQINSRKNILHKSFALKASKNRLELLNYKSDKKIGVEIKDLYNDHGTPQGTKVMLKIPLSKI